MTLIVRDPGFHEPGDDDDCTRFRYFCQAHDRVYRQRAEGDVS